MSCADMQNVGLGWGKKKKGILDPRIPTFCMSGHVSRVTCHMPRVTCHGETSQWRVCYQRGLPCLVYIIPPTMMNNILPFTCFFLNDNIKE